MTKPAEYINTSKKQLYRKNKISHKPLHTNAVQCSKSPYQKREKKQKKQQKQIKITKSNVRFAGIILTQPKDNL